MNDVVDRRALGLNDGRRRKAGSGGTSDTLSRLTASWFWSTLLGAYYIGVVHVLPDLYNSDTTCLFLPAQRFLASFMLFEILVNWLCVRFVTSYYQPEPDTASPVTSSHSSSPCKPEMERSSSHRDHNGNSGGGGFVIDLALLRAAKPANGNGNVDRTTVFSLPVSSVQSLDEPNVGGIGGGPETRWRRGDTIYVVATSGRHSDCDNRPLDPETDLRRNLAAGTRRLVYPYWSWKPCPICRHKRPPRAHHCRRCDACVLKRDHHCLLVGRCVGLDNQRHFVVFVTWTTVALGYSLLHAVVYAFSRFVPRNSYWDLLLPVTALRALAGSVRLMDVAMVAVFYSLGWFLFTSIRFAIEQWTIVCRGVTSFEAEHQIKVGVIYELI